jgi:ABC-type transporter Mla subunit MlaD
MSDELYLDLVSKTIISMLSKEISAHVGSQIGVQVGDLLNNAIGGLISDKISAQTEKLNGRILELEGTLKPLISGLSAEISGRVNEGLPALAGTITNSIGSLSKQMANISESTKAIADKTNMDMAKHVMDGLEKQAEDVFLKTSGAVRKDLSAVNESILKNLGEQNKLIGEALGGRIKDISTKIDASFADIGGKISTVVDSTAKLAGESSLDMIKHVMDGLEKQVQEAAKTSGAIRKDFLSAINDAIQKSFGEQNRLIGDALGGRIIDISAKMDASFADIGRKISGVVDSTAKLAGESNLDMIKHVTGGLGTQIEDVFKTAGAIKKDLSAINESIQKNLGGRIEEISAKIDKSLDNLGGRISNVIDSSAKLADRANLEVVRQVTDGLEKQAEDASKTSGAIKKDLSAINESLQKNFGDQHKIIGDALGGHIEGIYEKIDTSFVDIASIRQTLQQREKEEGEMIKGVFYSVKKLTNDFNKEREDSILYNRQFLTSMGELKERIGDLLSLKETMQYSVKEQNKVLADTVGGIISTLEKQLPLFSGKLDQTLSGIDAKITAFEREAQKQINNTNADFMKFIDENVRNNLKELGAGYGSLKGEIGGLRQLLDGNVKEQNNMLQGVFLSVKKMLNIITKERDTTEKVSNELTNALDNLYSQIRRLESEKDELDVELLRFGGDDYFKSKFKMLENELSKAKNLAEKYQDEKRELEQKYLKIRDEWNQAQRMDTDGAGA